MEHSVMVHARTPYSQYSTNLFQIYIQLLTLHADFIEVTCQQLFISSTLKKQSGCSNMKTV